MGGTAGPKIFKAAPLRKNDHFIKSHTDKKWLTYYETEGIYYISYWEKVTNLS